MRIAPDRTVCAVSQPREDEVVVVDEELEEGMEAVGEEADGSEDEASEDGEG